MKHVTVNVVPVVTVLVVSDTLEMVLNVVTDEDDDDESVTEVLEDVPVVLLLVVLVANVVVVTEDVEVFEVTVAVLQKPQLRSHSPALLHVGQYNSSQTWHMYCPMLLELLSRSQTLWQTVWFKSTMAQSVFDVAETEDAEVNVLDVSVVVCGDVVEIVVVKEVAVTVVREVLVPVEVVLDLVSVDVVPEMVDEEVIVDVLGGVQ
jgi:hypothetical protein